ncbi:M23 family metallopeptidase [Shimazuella alba]|uniref:Peptidoglycan DD-metalloendopeptidase family protein n=1 Tax=Shimazuella alba TaxID=2690964 RepID=A0A6I4VXR7_9BACL|nr:M23 family metallopeptidase [Shimazuella alba]MXQ55328.1 peptidoglycan DD-metalloendopeptidase family protein [Shimazuella alba]
MVDWGYELNKNREKKIRSLERKLELGRREPSWEPKEIETDIEKQSFMKWSDTPKNKEYKKPKNVFLFQLVAAAMLFLITVLGSRYPAAEEWIHTAWNQKIPYDKLTAYYQEIVGSRPTLLPVFSGEKKQIEKWAAPVKGKIVLSFNEQRKGVVIQTTKNVPVAAAKSGTIIFVGDKTGIGQTVIVRHGDGKETWYGFLGKVNLHVKDNVKRGQIIGQVKPRNNQYFVYVGLQENGQFIDPTGIIPLR